MKLIMLYILAFIQMIKEKKTFQKFSEFNPELRQLKASLPKQPVPVS